MFGLPGSVDVGSPGPVGGGITGFPGSMGGGGVDSEGSSSVFVTTKVAPCLITKVENPSGTDSSTSVQKQLLSNSRQV